MAYGEQRPMNDIEQQQFDAAAQHDWEENFLPPFDAAVRDGTFRAAIEKLRKRAVMQASDNKEDDMTARRFV